MRAAIRCEISIECKDLAIADDVMVEVLEKAGFEVSRPIIIGGSFIVRIPPNVQGDDRNPENQAA